MRYCHCLCGYAHPGEQGICEFDQVVTSLTAVSRLLGAVRIPACAPCAAAVTAAHLDDELAELLRDSL